MSADQSKPVVEALNVLLASTYTLYLKTHNYHWNVTGPMFVTLHALFENQYTELAVAVDEIAERIRTLGSHAPGSYSEFSRLSRVGEEQGRPRAEEMIRKLVADQETVIATARAVIDAAGKADDPATIDMGTRRMEVHEKSAWVLRSHLE